MKISNSLTVLVLISLVICSSLLQIASADHASTSHESSPAVPEFCASKCDYRCSKNWRKSFCVKLCMTCCGKCKCVPSGPLADKAECPCYRDMKNKKGGSKCP